MAHAAAIDDVGHLHARSQLVRLHVHGEDADLALLHVGGDDVGQRGQRPRREVFEDERLARRRRPVVDLVDQAGGDVFAFAVGDDGDALVRLDVEADANRVAGAGEQFGVDGFRYQRSAFPVHSMADGRAVAAGRTLQSFSGFRDHVFDDLFGDRWFPQTP